MKNRNINHKYDWMTPPEVLSKLDIQYKFQFDPCPYKHNVNIWDGLNIEWQERNFINPPYSQKLKEAFVLKAI